MSETENVEPKTELQHSEVSKEQDASGGPLEVDGQVGHSYDLDEKATAADYKADAIEAENAEHNMTVLEAVRAYPMASFWAFVMSSTIVSRLFPSPLDLPPDTQLTQCSRLWNLTTSSFAITL
jgi:hypothetical protein